MKSALGRPGKTDWIKRRCLCPSLSIRFPLFVVFGKGDKGEALNMFYPQPTSVISNLNPLFLSGSIHFLSEYEEEKDWNLLIGMD